MRRTRMNAWLDAPLAIVVTMKGMAHCNPAPQQTPSAPTEEALCSGCGGYRDACQCDNPGYPPPGWTPEPEPVSIQPASCVRCKLANMYGPPVCSECRTGKAAEKIAAEVFPTLAQRLAESIKDDRRID